MRLRLGTSASKKKSKTIRQDYSKAVTSARRSGSGRVVTTLWGGSPATQPLSFGVDLQGINNDENHEIHAGEHELEGNRIRIQCNMLNM